MLFSIEDAKQKSEYDKKMRLAEEKKAGVRKTIEELRQQFKQLLTENTKLPEHLRLNRKEFEMDPEIKKELARQTEEKVCDMTHCKKRKRVSRISVQHTNINNVRKHAENTKVLERLQHNKTNTLKKEEEIIRKEFVRFTEESVYFYETFVCFTVRTTELDSGCRRPGGCLYVSPLSTTDYSMVFCVMLSDSVQA